MKGFTDALRVEVEQLDEAPVSITLIQPTAVNTPYPQHARNYMAQEPKLPSPMIDPHRVAEAILEAATEGGRDVTVGAMAKLDTTVSKLLPSLGDKSPRRFSKRRRRAAVMSPSAQWPSWTPQYPSCCHPWATRCRPCRPIASSATCRPERRKEPCSTPGAGQVYGSAPH
ncbi:hypothetical protein [Frateuria flava]|uniref:hypothetical protein n=1 Tax=Frateuria flava TaxID=2821489 RepID=UPI0031590D76